MLKLCLYLLQDGVNNEVEEGTEENMKEEDHWNDEEGTGLVEEPKCDRRNKETEWNEVEEETE